MIGIIGAMQVEIDGICQAMTQRTEETLSSMIFHRGLLGGRPVIVAKCAPGKVNAAICAQTMILKYQPSCIVNPGVAGGIGQGVRIGDVVVGTACVQHDMDTSDLGDPLGEVPTNLGNRVQFPCDDRLQQLFAKEAAHCYAGTVHRGIIATGDQFIGSAQRSAQIHRHFGAIACEMEGGAIAQVCFLNGVPFLGLRAISDNGNEEGSVDFPTFVKEMAEKVTLLLNRTVEKIETLLA